MCRKIENVFFFCIASLRIMVLLSYSFIGLLSLIALGF